MKQATLKNNLQITQSESVQLETEQLLKQLQEYQNLLEKSEKARIDWQNYAEELQELLNRYLESSEGILQTKIKNMQNQNQQSEKEKWLMFLKLKFTEEKLIRYEEIARNNRISSKERMI